jgi:hypothetical protein
MTWIDWEKESALVSDVQAGLEAALSEIDNDLEGGHFNEVSGYNEANIKTNKIVHRAIDDQNLPILHTWFRYGQYEPHDEFTPQNIHPRPLTDTNVESPEEPSLPRRNYYSAQEYKGLFLSYGLEEIIEQNLYDFLEENYKVRAPEEFKDLYLANLHIFRLFDKLMEKNQSVEYAQDVLEDLENYSIDLQIEMLSNGVFTGDVENHVERSLDMIQDSLLMHAKGDPTEEQREVIRGIRKFYHEYVWRWPALIISGEKAEGAEVEKFRQGYSNELRKIQIQYPKETDDFYEDIRRVGLFPSSSDFQALVQDTPEPLQQLEKASMDIY